MLLKFVSGLDTYLAPYKVHSFKNVSFLFWWTDIGTVGNQFQVKVKVKWNDNLSHVIWERLYLFYWREKIVSRQWKIQKHVRLEEKCMIITLSYVKNSICFSTKSKNQVKIFFFCLPWCIVSYTSYYFPRN